MLTRFRDFGDDRSCEFVFADRQQRSQPSSLHTSQEGLPESHQGDVRPPQKFTHPTNCGFTWKVCRGAVQWRKFPQRTPCHTTVVSHARREDRNGTKYKLGRTRATLFSTRRQHTNLATEPDIEPCANMRKNAKSKHRTSFAILRVFPWLARPIKEGLGYP